MQDVDLMFHIVERHGLKPENIPQNIQPYEITLFRNKHTEVHGQFQMDHVHKPDGTIVWICQYHQPVQHRDGKPPWCKKCGLDATFQVPVSRFDRS